MLWVGVYKKRFQEVGTIRHHFPKHTSHQVSFPPTKTGSTVLKCPKLYIKLVVGTVRISTLAKPNGDYMTEKLNTSRQSPVTVIHQLLQNTSLQLGPFWHFSKRKIPIAKSRRLFLLGFLKPALNETISSEKL